MRLSRFKLNSKLESCANPLFQDAPATKSVQWSFNSDFEPIRQISWNAVKTKTGRTSVWSIGKHCALYRQELKVSWTESILLYHLQIWNLKTSEACNSRLKFHLILFIEFLSSPRASSLFFAQNISNVRYIFHSNYISQCISDSRRQILPSLLWLEKRRYWCL